MGKDSRKEKENESTDEWRARTGTNPPLDTGKLRALDGESGADDPVAHEPQDDPYNKTIPPLLDATAKQHRRSLDDMRRLSEEIKASRTKK
jgi:hypothetical protein